jgi:hypothetical protein
MEEKKAIQRIMLSAWRGKEIYWALMPQRKLRSLKECISAEEQNRYGHASWRTNCRNDFSPFERENNRWLM